MYKYKHAAVVTCEHMKLQSSQSIQASGQQTERRDGPYQKLIRVLTWHKAPSVDLGRLHLPPPVTNFYVCSSCLLGSTVNLYPQVQLEFSAW